MQYKSAVLLARTKEMRDDGSIVEIVVWELPHPIPPCKHRFKYRLFYGRPGQPWVRYDNERGKGDHRHVDGKEHRYEFESVERLLADFEAEVNMREGE